MALGYIRGSYRWSADKQPHIRRALIAGPLLFLIVGLGGLWLGDAFLAYPVAYAKPLLLAIEFAMTLTVAVTLALLIAGPSEREPSP